MERWAGTRRRNVQEEYYCVSAVCVCSPANWRDQSWSLLCPVLFWLVSTYRQHRVESQVGDRSSHFPFSTFENRVPPWCRMCGRIFPPALLNSGGAYSLLLCELAERHQCPVLAFVLASTEHFVSKDCLCQQRGRSCKRLRGIAHLSCITRRIPGSQDEAHRVRTPLVRGLELRVRIGVWSMED